MGDVSKASCPGGAHGKPNSEGRGALPRIDWSCCANFRARRFWYTVPYRDAVNNPEGACANSL